MSACMLDSHHTAHTPPSGVTPDCYWSRQDALPVAIQTVSKH